MDVANFASQGQSLGPRGSARAKSSGFFIGMAISLSKPLNV